MKTILVLFVMIICLSGFSRLGELEDNCDKRYDMPITTNTNPLDKITLKEYQKNGFKIEIFFLNHKAAAIFYSKINEDHISSDEVKVLLESNSEGCVWKQIDFIRQSFDEKDALKRKELIETSMSLIRWVRSDGKATSEYSNSKGSLSIYYNVILNYLKKNNTKTTDGL